jgi:hypothetical protein
MNKVYIILRKQYEYDDVYYTETEGYELNSVYDNKEQAMNACQTLLIQHLNDIINIEIALNDLHTTKENFEELTKIIPQENLLCAYDNYNYHVWGIKGNFEHDKLTDEQLLKISEITKYNPFDVMEKKVYGSSVLSC